MYFNEIIGHERIIENLISTVKLGKISHAYIFDGADGIGKEKTAKIFAEAILCEDFKGELCGECKSCHLTFSETHPDLKVVDLTIGEDGKQRASIPVEAVRQLKKDVYLKPFFSKKKIYILENAEKMTVEAQNAMLKIFEEPPEYVTMILICNGLSKLLSTIKSRAVIFKFPNLKPKELEKYLNTYYNDIDNKSIYTNISDGSISKMMSLISDEQSLNFRESVLKSFIKLLKSDSTVSFNDLFDIFIKNKDERADIISQLSIFAFDIVYAKTGNISKIVNVDYKNEIEEIAGKLSLSNIYNIEKIISVFSEQVNKNANYKLAVLNTMINIKEEIYG